MSEHDEQVQLFNFARGASLSGLYPCLDKMFSVPNAGKRSNRQGAWFVAEGLKKGVPDVWLPVGFGRWKGLLFEMKYKGGDTSKEQRDWLCNKMAGQGWMIGVCYSGKQAITLVERYINSAVGMDEYQIYYEWIMNPQGHHKKYKRKKAELLMNLPLIDNVPNYNQMCFLDIL